MREIVATSLALTAWLITQAAAAVGDTTVTVKKGDDPDFTIVAGSDEIAGDPAIADKEARDSWKEACAQWKSELRELNKDNHIVAMSCGAPKASAGLNAATLYSSQASYQIRVRVRGDGKSK